MNTSDVTLHMAYLAGQMARSHCLRADIRGVCWPAGQKILPGMMRERS